MKKVLALILVIAMGVSIVACGDKPAPPETDEPNAQQQINQEQPQEPPVSNDPKPSETNTEPPETNMDPDPAPSTPQDNLIAKINGGADETGIYSIVVKLTDQAADKGVVEMVYYGAKASPQENSVVNTFRIEYYRTDAGTFEIKTFFNGEAYQNQHDKDEVKVVNTFDASLRAGNVIISYTPDGGETQEIFRADAEYFRSSAK